MSDTVGAALAAAKAMGVDRLDAQLLLARELRCGRAWLLAHEDAALAPPQRAGYAAACARRAEGVPLAYLLGEREFHGLMLKVTPAVLIPRPDTETLVDWAIELLHGPLAAVASPRVVDLGTGSGAVALAVKRSRGDARVVATDASEAALGVARDNAQAHRLEVEFSCGDWWQPLRRRRFQLALSNPPYVAQGDAHLQALRHEPALALTPGADGFGAIERIVLGAPRHLLPGGWLLLEHGHDQAARVRERLRGAGFERVETRTDLSGRPRCSGGRRAGAA